MAGQFRRGKLRLLLPCRWLLLLSCLTIRFCHGSRLGSNAGSQLKSSGTPSDVTSDLAVAIDAASFNSTLASAPALFAIVEFYANWCPACRNYKPHYEKVARLFNGPDAIHPGILFMAKVDCALKVNSMLCEHFKISHYPTLMWAPKMKSAWVAEASAGWEMVEHAHTADLLLQAVNKKINKSYTLEDMRHFNEPLLLNSSELNLGQVGISIHDIEEATAKALDIIVADKLLNEKTRHVFIQFLQLLVVHHPSKKCKRGVADLLMSLEDWWPSLPRQGNEANGNAKDMYGPDYKALETFHICGDHAPHDYWMFCRGSRKDTRGYSCGLWLLFHALSVRVEDRLAATALQTICGFIGNFFNCKECSEHFLQYCSSAKLKVSSRRQLVIWLWDVHNQVNSRLQREEASLGNGDPMFVKQPWPPQNLCKSCWKPDLIKGAENRTDSTSFSYVEVYSFLVKFYGHSLSLSNVTGSTIISVKKTMSSNVPETAATSAATIPPLVAALAIALASCGFVAAACFWRSRQRKRKYGDDLN